MWFEPDTDALGTESKGNREAFKLHQEQQTQNMQFEILIVDDNFLQGTTRKAILGGAGLKIRVTESPLEALTLLADPEVRSSIRALITDHVMPGMRGSELVRRARTILPELPILVITGAPEAASDYDGLQIRFELKPVLPDVLLHTVREMVDASVRRSA
jgi:CheY-like chemotaxis protein